MATQRPVPARRRLNANVDTSSKTKLVQSFYGFIYSAVTEKNVELARQCLAAIPTRSARYEHVPFHMILQWNEGKANSFSMIAQACDLLLKYVINLLKPKRPQVWRSIKITNSHFCARVDCMVGAREILQKIGYSETLESAMQFPDHVREPDKEKLKVIAAELLMAKLEAEALQGGQMPARQLSSPQSSLSRQGSTPGTPTSGQRDLPSPSPQRPPRQDLPSPSPQQAPREGLPSPSLHRPHNTHLSHSQPSSGETTPSAGFQPPPGLAEGSGDHFTPQLASVAHTKYPTPTEPFSPHPSFATNTNEQPSTDDPASGSQPEREGGPTSFGSSSGDSNYGTPPSSTSPNVTGEMNTSNSAANFKNQLKELQQERERIKGRIVKEKMATVGVNISSQPPKMSEKEEMRKKSAMTSIHPQSAGGPLMSEQRSSFSGSKVYPRAKPASVFSQPPIIEEEPLENGGGASLQTPPPVAKAPTPSPRGPISGTPCPHCNHIIEASQPSCGFCNVPVTSLPSPALPPPIHNTGNRLDSVEPQPKPPLRASAAGAQEAMLQHRNKTQAHGNAMMEPSPQPAVMAASSSSAEGGATGTSSGKETSFMKTYDEKLEAWKKAWRERGYSDDEIPAEPASRPLPQPKRPESTKRQKKRAKDFEPVRNTLDELKRYQREAERREMMEEIGSKGESLMECIKFCVKDNYALEEVALAYRKCGKAGKEKVLAYLKQAWAVSVRDLQGYVMGMVDGQGRSVGCPSNLEARKYLVLADGNVEAAAQEVYHFRRKKVEELQLKFRPHCELEWEASLQALSAFDMSVEKAACAIQCETLQPLYEFIFSEWTEVAATDMKKIKGRLKNREEDKDAREANLRMLMGEFKLPTLAKAGMALDLMKRVEVDESMDYPLSYYIEAARDFSSLEDAERGLIKECPICEIEIPVHETITMPGCTDTLCKDCFKFHFKVVITEKGVKHFNCPMCDQPDMTNRDDAQDLYQELFVHLIHEHVPEHYDLVQTKLAERNLQKDPGFRWCANDKCGNCFINPNLQRKKIQCPTCNELMCFQCKKPWEEQHNGLTCEEFADWKRQNDPRFQKEGLAAHLQANGIECPDCHMRYELARGGCMHFKCTRCPNEFCSGCGGSFKKAQVCGRFQSCATKGLHAHHPRDCLYFMRDFSVDQLQGFLQENKVEFLTQPSAEQLEAARRERAVADDEEQEDGGDAAAKEGEEQVELYCSVMLQKELVDKLVDEACGEAVKEGHAGLCEKHYKEYLVDKINKAGLDPLPLYEKEGHIEIILNREEKAVPEREDEETDEHYRERLIEHVKREVPLGRQAAPHPPLAAQAAAAAVNADPEPAPAEQQ